MRIQLKRKPKDRKEQKEKRISPDTLVLRCITLQVKIILDRWEV